MFVLTLIITMGGSFESPVAIQTHDYYSQESCIKAQQKFLELPIKKGGNGTIIAYCTENKAENE